MTWTPLAQRTVGTAYFAQCVCALALCFSLGGCLVGVYASGPGEHVRYAVEDIRAALEPGKFFSFPTSGATTALAPLQDSTGGGRPCELDDDDGCLGSIVVYDAPADLAQPAASPHDFFKYVGPGLLGKKSVASDSLPSGGLTDMAVTHHRVIFVDREGSTVEVSLDPCPFHNSHVASTMQWSVPDNVHDFCVWEKGSSELVFHATADVETRDPQLWRLLFKQLGSANALPGSTCVLELLSGAGYCLEEAEAMMRALEDRGLCRASLRLAVFEPVTGPEFFMCQPFGRCMPIAAFVVGVVHVLVAHLLSFATGTRPGWPVRLWISIDPQGPFCRGPRRCVGEASVSSEVAPVAVG